MQHLTYFAHSLLEAQSPVSEWHAIVKRQPPTTALAAIATSSPTGPIAQLNKTSGSASPSVYKVLP